MPSKRYVFVDLIENIDHHLSKFDPDYPLAPTGKLGCLQRARAEVLLLREKVAELERQLAFASQPVPSEPEPAAGSPPAHQEHPTDTK